MSVDPFLHPDMWKWPEFHPTTYLKMSVDPFLHPYMWKLPEFYSTTSFGDVCGPISSSRHMEMARVSPHNIIWRFLKTHFFIQTCGNGQSFIPQHHLEISVNPFLHPDMWKWLDFNHLEMSVDPFLHPELWKYPEFHPTISFWDVCGCISSSRYVKMARV